MEVFKKTLLPKIWENNAILDWSNTVDYSIGSIVKLNGGGALYRALAPSGPNQSSGPQSPETDDGTYWINESDIVHRFGNEEIGGQKTFITFPRIKYNHPYLVLYEASGSLYDSNSLWGGIVYKDKDDVECGKIEYTKYTTREHHFVFGLYDASGNGAAIEKIFITRYLTSSVLSLFPETSNKHLLGNANHRWAEVYASTASINTSDERLKSTITSVPDNVLDAWSDVGFVQYQMKDALQEKGSTARFHSGLIAQSIDQAFSKHNLDASRYGLFCYDEWEAIPEEKDGEGNIVQKAQPAGNQYSLRYEEALCMEAAYQRRENRRLKDRVSELENKVLQLEDKLNQLLNK